MVQKEMGFDRWDVLVDCGDYFDVKSITESECERFVKMLEEDPVEDGYKLFMSLVIKKLSNKQLKKRKEKADNEEGTEDFANGLWLKKLIQHGIAYALEVERDGLCFLKYEGNVVEGLDKECGFSGYKRKLRNEPRKNYGPLNERRITSSEKDAEDSGRRKLKSVFKINNRPLNESRCTSSEKKDGDSGRGKLRSGLGINIGPSNESRFILVKESEDSSRGRLRRGSEKSSWPLDESRFTSSEEDAEDYGRKKLRIGSEKNDRPSDKSMYTKSEEAGDLFRRKLRSGSKKNNRLSNESSFTSSEEDAEDYGRKKLRNGSKKNDRPSDKSMYTSSEEAGDLCRRKLRSGLKKNNRLSNESSFTSSEEDAEDLGRKKLRNGSKKNTRSSNKSMYTSSEEAEASGRRNLRSRSKKNNSPSNKSSFTSSEEDVEDSGQRRLRSGGVKSEKTENGKTSTIVTDPHYRVFLRNLKEEEDWAVLEDGVERVVFEQSNGGERNHQRDDEWGPSVEILDCDTYYKEVNSGPSVEAVTNGLDNMDKDNTNSNLSTQLGFRRQLITVLRKPYDEKEYAKLWKDVKFRKQEKRHLDLRHGRERTCSIDKYGKSYLDHHPDLENQLSRLDDLENKPTRLNLLRGFFFWLKNASHNGSFHPWNDAECLAINPDAC